MTRNKDSGHGEQVLELMRAFDLFAVDTLFKPGRKTWGTEKKMRYCNATYGKKFRQKAKGKSLPALKRRRQWRAAEITVGVG